MPPYVWFSILTTLLTCWNNVFMHRKILQIHRCHLKPIHGNDGRRKKIMDDCIADNRIWIGWWMHMSNNSDNRFVYYESEQKKNKVNSNINIFEVFLWIKVNNEPPPILVAVSIAMPVNWSNDIRKQLSTCAYGLLIAVYIIFFPTTNNGEHYHYGD